LDHIIVESPSGDVWRVKGFDYDVVDAYIPDTIDGKPVTVIDWYAFANNDKLRSIRLPETITHISRYAFVHCHSLETINMPEKLSVIEQYAFADCPSLKFVNLTNTQLTEIQARAFSYCTHLTNVTVPSTVRSIDEYAFFECTRLDSITFEGNTTSFEKRPMGYIFDGYNYKVRPGFCIFAAENSSAYNYAADLDIIGPDACIPYTEPVSNSEIAIDGDSASRNEFCFIILCFCIMLFILA